MTMHEATTTMVALAVALPHKTAKAAAWNEVLQCLRCPAYEAGIVGDGFTVFEWSLRRGQLWA